MTRLRQLASLLAEKHTDHVADVHMLRHTELHCSVRPPGVHALAVLLRIGFGAELIFMAAADRRQDRGAFEVHYLFAPERENWFVHATVTVPAEAPALVSKDHKALLFPVTMAGAVADAEKNIDKVLAITEPANGKDGFQVHTAGFSSVGHDCYPA